MNYENLLVDIEGGIAEVQINRPKALNALNLSTLKDLQQAFIALEQDDAVKVVILTGAGEKAFVAGADIAQMQDMTALEARNFAQFGQLVFRDIENFSKPVIAAINGFALGGGCELAMACDIRLASEKGKFGQPEVSLGVIPGFAGTQRLARLVGKGKAKELIFTGDIIAAEEACRLGLVNQVFAPDQLREEARKMAKKVAGKGAIAVRLSKDAINRGLEMDLDKASAYEVELFGLCFATEDQKEGMQAFLEKRSANFKNL
ncbi:MAG: short-chain-enoyl-CoA hydratase [Desulfuromonadales bacterium]|nr:short-chain-enoyl-CoA hydratase [Desulfuromonadales bacterium]